MSKDFDTTLSDALDLAAAAAQTAGAPAARIRGRKRTMRKRIAVSTLSFALIAGGTTVAFKAASSNNGGIPQLPAASPHVTAGPSLAASPTPPATSSPPSSGAVTSSPPSSGPASSSPPPSSPPPSSSATTGDPHQAVAAAWLTAGQMPFADTFHWKARQADSQGSSPIGQQLTPTVFYVANSTAFQALTMCADPAGLLGRTTGAQHTEYAATSGSGNQASQFIFFFADAASARQTFTWLQSQYGPSCLSGSGATITKTAGDGLTSAAWLTLKGAAALPDLAAYTREYFVQRGNTIAFVSVTSSTSSLPTAYDDAAQLSTIASHLCVYGGACH